MNLSELTSKPQLVKITIDDEDIVSKYNETIDFYIYDRQNLDVYMKLTALQEASDIVALSDIVRIIVLDEAGKPILNEGKMLPFDIMMKVIQRSVKHLGNLDPQTLTT